jgi:TM2 domain-containing membrane protein YozV
MNNESAVYDLGAVDSAIHSDTTRSVPRQPASVRRVPQLARRPLDSFADSLELFAPGLGQLFRARWADGLFALSVCGFLIALGWAIWETLDRVAASLTALGYPSHLGLYALAAIYACIASLHTANVLYGTTRDSTRAHPVSAGCASLLVPGWGQLLNRQPAKAAAFVGGLWSVGIAWLLASPWIAGLLQSQGVGLRGGFELLSSPVVLWTAPAVLWVLAVYDAVASARK